MTIFVAIVFILGLVYILWLFRSFDIAEQERRNVIKSMIDKMPPDMKKWYEGAENDTSVVQALQREYGYRYEIHYKRSKELLRELLNEKE